VSAPSTVDLDALLLNLDGLNLEETEDLARSIYTTDYIGGENYKVGKHYCHDGSEVYFHLDQFDHAFYTSRDRARHQYLKDVLDISRLKRIKWIKHIIEGKVTKTACYRVLDYETKRLKRLYLVQERLYVVWLQPRLNGGWKFSSAYVATAQDVRRYCERQFREWVAP
jgi:hypothetical protein